MSPLESVLLGLLSGAAMAAVIGPWLWRRAMDRQIDRAISMIEDVSEGEPAVYTCPMDETLRQQLLEDLRTAPLAEVVQIWAPGANVIGVGVVTKTAERPKGEVTTEGE